MGRPISGEYRLGRRLLTGTSDPSGLGLSCALSGARVYANIEANPADHRGARVVPPGFLQAVVDDLAHATLAALRKRIGVVRESRLRFTKPLYTAAPARAEGRLIRDESDTGGVVEVEVNILNSKRELCLEATVEIFVLAAEQVRRMTPDGMIPLELKRFFG